MKVILLDSNLNTLTEFTSWSINEKLMRGGDIKINDFIDSNLPNLEKSKYVIVRKIYYEWVFKINSYGVCRRNGLLFSASLKVEKIYGGLSIKEGGLEKLLIYNRKIKLKSFIE